MLGFYDKIKEAKKVYMDRVVAAAQKYEYVVIYGAGRVAKPIANKLKEEQIDIVCFAVSDVRINVKEFMGKAVRQIEDIQLPVEKTLFIIAVKYVWAEEILEKLRKNGYINYIFPPKEIDYFAREDSDEVNRPIMEITTKVGCCVNCRYCPQKLLLNKYYESGNRPEYLSLEDYKKCLSQLPQNTIIDFCGFAEPFLNPEAVEMMEYTCAQGYDMRLFTTMVGLTKEGLERILDIPFLYVVLHTPDEQGFANISITQDYLDMLDMMLEHCKPDGSPFIDTANCQGIPHKKIVERTQGKLRIMSQLYDRAGNIKDDELFEPIEWIGGSVFCSRVNWKLDYNVMLPDGTVVLCNYDFGMKHVLGNLLEKPYEEIMEGKSMQQLVCALDDAQCDLLCRKCNYAVKA